MANTVIKSSLKSIEFNFGDESVKVNASFGSYNLEQMIIESETDYIRISFANHSKRFDIGLPDDTRENIVKIDSVNGKAIGASTSLLELYNMINNCKLMYDLEAWSEFPECEVKTYYFSGVDAVRNPSGAANIDKKEFLRNNEVIVIQKFAWNAANQVTSEKSNFSE